MTCFHMLLNIGRKDGEVSTSGPMTGIALIFGVSPHMKSKTRTIFEAFLALRPNTDVFLLIAVY